MQPLLEHIVVSPQSSFTCRAFDLPAFPFNWHVHPEVELTLITEGRGRRFVGDHIGEFTPGDLVLLGSDLPHTWYSQPPRKPRTSRTSRNPGGHARSLVVQFRPDFLGETFYEAPEMQTLRPLLRRAQRGLRFHGQPAARAARDLTAMDRLSGMTRLLALFQVLVALAATRHVRPLASRGFRGARQGLRDADRRRIDTACELINRRFTEPIRQTDAADAIHMSPAAFSRFFRRSTGHSFAGYLHELRIGAACRLLIETDKPITDICFESGFENLSNFNRVFRRLKDCTPRAFRQAFAQTDGGGAA